MRKSTSPTKARPQTTASPSKKLNGRQNSIVTTGTMRVVVAPISQAYVTGGYTERVVTLEHVSTVETEVKRERTVTESVQSDNAMLREQLARANDRIQGLEKVRIEQASDIT